MTEQIDQIVYPGSKQYSSDEIAAPGVIPIELDTQPIIRVIDTAYIMFEVPDLNIQRDFLSDFGLLLAHQDEQTLYMRGYGAHPYIYVAQKADVARFVGAGFLARSREELECLASATGKAIERVDDLGGGERIRLHDPDGFVVDVVHGRKAAEELPTRRHLLPANNAFDKPRTNQGLRTPVEPSAIFRFGHYVLAVSDFETSWKWYQTTLGLLATDVLCTDVGRPILAFCRVNNGSVPADHHSIVLSQGISAKYLHGAFEALDIDAIGQGQQHLKSKGWHHYWGIGRHILGSQIFDYWLDPFGHEVEHYADGDVFDSSYPTQYHLMDRGGLWAWGQDLPASMKPRPSFRELTNILLGKGLTRKILGELKRAMDRRPRPWLR